jgi:hypothetical protein
MSKTLCTLDQAKSFAGVFWAYFAGWCLPAFLVILDDRLHLPKWTFLAAYCARSAVEFFVCSVFRLDIERRLGLYHAYLVCGSFFLGIGIGAWAALQPREVPLITDATIRGLTILLPMFVMEMCQPIAPEPAGQTEARPPEPEIVPAYTYVRPLAPAPRPAPEPTPPPVHVPTPLEMELARIEAEAKEFQLDPHLVEAEKERARTEFAARNGTH